MDHPCSWKSCAEDFSKCGRLNSQISCPWWTIFVGAKDLEWRLPLAPVHQICESPMLSIVPQGIWFHSTLLRVIGLVPISCERSSQHLTLTLCVRVSTLYHYHHHLLDSVYSRIAAWYVLKMAEWVVTFTFNRNCWLFTFRRSNILVQSKSSTIIDWNDNVFKCTRTELRVNQLLTKNGSHTADTRLLVEILIDGNVVHKTPDIVLKSQSWNWPTELRM